MKTRPEKSGRAAGARKGDFGDAALISPDIAPTSDAQRTLTGPRERILWMALGAGCVTPALGRYGELGLFSGLAAAFAVALIIAAIGYLAAPTAARYGVGSGPLTRSTFGSWPAIPVHALRYVIGVVWAAAHAAPVLDWTSRLVVASVHAAEPVLEVEWTGPEWLLRLTVLALFALLLGWVSRGRIRRARKTARLALALVTLAGIAILVMAARAGVHLVPPNRPLDNELASHDVGLALVDALVLVWAVPEWVRYRDRKTLVSKPLALSLATAVALALLLLVVSLCSQALRGKSEGSLIADAAATYGLAMGWAAAIAELGVVFMVLPLFGVLTASLALCSLVPRFRYPYVAYVTAIVVTLASLLVTPVRWLVALAAPVLAAVLVDEQLVRGRAVAVLEELYQKGGIKPLPVVGMLAGSALVIVYREDLAVATGLGIVAAVIGTTLPLLARLGISRTRKRPSVVRNEPGAWAEPLEHDWANPDDPTRVTDPKK